jgi:hypothetical protein
MANESKVIQVIHGFGKLLLEEDDHQCDGLVGCFLGDRSVLEFNGDVVVQEPEFVTFKETGVMRTITLRPVSEATIKRMTQSTDFVKLGTKGDSVEIPSVLPLPVSWVPFLLEKPCTNCNAYLCITKLQTAWKAEGRDVAH